MKGWGGERWCGEQKRNYGVPFFFFLALVTTSFGEGSIFG